MDSTIVQAFTRGLIYFINYFVRLFLLLFQAKVCFIFEILYTTENVL